MEFYAATLKGGVTIYKRILFILLIISTTFYLGCSSEKKNFYQINKHNVNFEVAIEKYKNPYFRFKGKTNLPDNTVLIITVNNENKFINNSKVIVNKGQFISDWFGKFTSNNTLKPSKYMILIQTIKSHEQPKLVRDYFGVNGENLYGKFIRKDKIKENYLYYKLNFDGFYY